MVLRNSGWRIVTLAAAGLAAAGAWPQHPLAQDRQTTGSVPGNLVWGGHVPPPPRSGEAPVYVPSPAYSSDANYHTPNQSNFSHIQPTPPQFLPPPVEAASAPVVPVPPATLPHAAVASAPAPSLAPVPGDYGRTYPVQDAPAPADLVREAALPPLGPGRVIDDASPSAPGGEYGSRPEDEFDPWEGLTDVTPGAQAPLEEPATLAPPAPVQRSAPAVPSYAALEQVRPAPRQERGWGWNPFRWGRGSQESRTPSGYRALPREEAACRRELQKLGARFTDARSVGDGRTHGIRNPVRVTMAAKDIAMQPPALLSCETALQTARWLENDVRSAARWTLWKRPAAVINASSYRVSRIAGSRTISEHALGNALDIRGLRFTDGSTFLVEPKGAFSPVERRFQQQIREAGCQYFGTVLGPGYNKAHADHFHFDVKSRMRPVCK